MRVFACLGLILLISSCSEAPTETKAKAPEKPDAPITAQQAFRYTYPGARAWAADALPLRIRSINLPDVPSEGGKAGGWEIIYVSAMTREAKIYTWGAEEAEGNLHKGVFAAKAQSWTPSGQENPFQANAFQVDSPMVLETAIAASKAYLDKPGTKPPVNFLVEFTPRFPGAVWRVMWGETASTAQHTVFIDTGSGQVVGKD